MSFPLLHVVLPRYGICPKGVLHLGANIGEEANDYHANGAERVIWVEAHPEAFRGLALNVASRPGHTAHFGAISDVDDAEIDFNLASNIVSSSILRMHKHKEKHPDVSEIGVLKARTVTVDTLFQRLKLRPEDYEFLNMDLQGAELMALRGAESYLRTAKWVWTEINTEELYHGCVLFPDLTAHLNARGFELVEYGLWNDVVAWGDALYARK